MACGLELGADDLICLHRADGEGDQRGRHILIHEGAGHGVLTADGGSTQLQLGIQCAEKGGKGLAPADRLGAQTLEELLEREVGLGVIGTGGNQLCHGGVDCAVSAVVGRGGQRLGIAAPSHQAALLGVLTGQHRQQRCHRLCGGTLTDTAVGHQEGACADGAVETLHETAAGGAS